MSQLKVTLQNKTGDELLPKTSGDQVFLDGGTSVSAKIAALESAFASGIEVKGTVGAGGTDEALPADSFGIGDMYVVKTAGTYAGQECEAGDLVLCIKAYEAEGAADTDWTVIQNNLNRAVTGPASAADGNLMSFDGASGTVAKDSGIKTADVSGAVSKAHQHANAADVLDKLSAQDGKLKFDGQNVDSDTVGAVLLGAEDPVPENLAENGIVFRQTA